MTTKVLELSRAHIHALVKTMTFHYERIGKTNTIVCCSYYPNGFKVGYGESNAMNIEDFDEQIGKDCALEECIKNTEAALFFAEAYRLKMTGTLTNPEIMARHTEMKV